MPSKTRTPKPATLPFDSKQNVFTTLIKAFQYLQFLNSADISKSPEIDEVFDDIVKTFTMSLNYTSDGTKEALTSNLEKLVTLGLVQENTELKTVSFYIVPKNITFVSFMQPVEGRRPTMRFFTLKGEHTISALEDLKNATEHVIQEYESFKLKDVAEFAVNDYKTVDVISNAWEYNHLANYLINIDQLDVTLAFDASSIPAPGSFELSEAIPTPSFTALTEKQIDQIENDLTDALTELNEDAEDPYFDPDSMEDNPTEFRNGNETELKEIVRLMVKALTPIASSEVYIYLDCAFDGESCAVNEINGITSEQCRISENDFHDLLETVLEYFSPEGDSWEYNDGAYNQKSGYSHSANSIYIEAESSASHHENIGAQTRLVEWLIKTNILGISEEAIKERLKLDI